MIDTLYIATGYFLCFEKKQKIKKAKYCVRNDIFVYMT